MKIKTPIVYGLACVLGAGYVAVVYGLQDHPNSEPNFRLLFILSFVAMSALAYPLGHAARESPWGVGLFTLVGISGGVFINAIYDGVAHHVDHNLFPVEIVFLAVFAMPEVIVGLAVGWLTRSRARPN
jgi:peptidoglycan/LPS O-acetylase OafA/YrhL